MTSVLGHCWGEQRSRRDVLSGGIALSLAATYPISACTASSGAAVLDVMDFIPSSERAAVIAGSSTFDCTSFVQDAIRRCEKTKSTLHISKGIYRVTSLTITGSLFRIDTDNDAVFKQLASASSGGARPVFVISNCRDLVIGRLSVIGNITTDLGEHNHAVVVGKSKNVKIDSIFAEDIRGDALYCYGRTTSDEEMLESLSVRSVSGRNVFRNLVSIAGGRVDIGEIVNAGPVGYRDLDVEPNAEGRYQPVELTLGRARVGSLEVTSDDNKTINRSVKIGELDADGNRIQPTTPPYPHAPGRNGYALGLAYVTNIDIDRATLRNYASYAVNLGEKHGEIRFGDLRIANCAFGERTFNSAIAKRGLPTGRLIIDRLLCLHPDNTKWLIHSDQTGMPVIIGGGEIRRGLLAVDCIVDATNLTIDAGGARGPAANILVRGGGSRLTSVSIKGAQDATLLLDSPGCALVEVSGVLANVAAGDSANVRLTKSLIQVSTPKR